MFSIFIIASVLAGLGQTDDPVRPVEPTAWGEFARLPARGSSPIRISMGTVPAGWGDRPVYWAKRIGRLDAGTTDSLKCPALAVVVQSMRHIRLPKVAPGEPEIMIGDGTMYSLTVPSSYHPPHSSNLSTLTITGGEGPLADWVNGALKKLEGCWSPT